MQTSSLPGDHFTEVLARLPAGVDLTALAFETRAIERRRDIGDGASLLRLALARGPGGLSLSQTAAWAGMIGLTELSSPGVKYRVDKAADFLDALVSRLLAEATQGTPAHWPGRILRAADGSGISQNASQGLDWRVHGVFDLGRGRFSHLALTDVQGAESMARGAVLEGEIRIGDRNYARAGVLRDLREQSNNKADFIVRVSWRAFALTTQVGRHFDLADHLARLPDTAGPHEICVYARTGRKTPPLPLRVIIMRKSPEAAEASRRKLPRNALRKQKKLNPRTVLAAGFMILATSLPTEGYKADAICAAYRLRWQIELAFKRLKSLLHMDQIPTRTAPASRSWLLSHLLLATLSDEMTQDLLECFPCGPE